jgi:hypothetical protein
VTTLSWTGRHPCPSCDGWIDVASSSAYPHRCPRPVASQTFLVIDNDAVERIAQRVAELMREKVAQE